MRENVKVCRLFPSSDSALSLHTRIKGARGVVLHGGVSPEECIQLELDAIRDIQFSSTPLFLRLNCVWAQKLMQ